MPNVVWETGANGEISLTLGTQQWGYPGPVTGENRGGGDESECPGRLIRQRRGCSRTAWT
nr:hypothetical protein [Photorhabdus asymbiotica]